VGGAWGGGGRGASPAATVVVLTACGSPAAGAAHAATWTACGGADAQTHVVRQFPRVREVVGNESIPAGMTALLCGDEGFGYRHILRRHQQDWGREPGAGGDWSGAADRAIAAALQNPQRVDYRSSNDTFCYSRGLAAGHDVAIVVVRSSDGAIITAYPGTHPCNDAAR